MFRAMTLSIFHRSLLFSHRFLEIIIENTRLVVRHILFKTILFAAIKNALNHLDPMPQIHDFSKQLFVCRGLSIL